MPFEQLDPNNTTATIKVYSEHPSSNSVTLRWVGDDILTFYTVDSYGELDDEITLTGDGYTLTTSSSGPIVILARANKSDSAGFGDLIVTLVNDDGSERDSSRAIADRLRLSFSGV